jgi:Xaa-Pro dipeptidase
LISNFELQIIKPERISVIMVVFDKNEYLSRIEKTKDKMEKSGLEVLLIVDPGNMNYLTGYDACSFYVPQVVIIGIDLEEPIWIGRKQDIACAKLTVWLSEKNIIGYPEDLVNHPVKHPISYITDIMKEHGLVKKVIGVEKEAYYFDIRSYEELKKNLPLARFQDSRLLVNQMRSIKSEKEIKIMKEAGKILENVIKTAIDSTEAGVRECDVVADILQAQARGAEDFGGNYPSISPLIFQGEKGSAPHVSWTDNPIQNETAVLYELAGCRHRYHTPIARTLYLGSNPPQKLVDMAKIVGEGFNKVYEFIKPGKTCEEVEAVWRKVISKVGLNKDSRIGYSIGLAYPPVWSENTMSMRPGDKTILKENMTFHVLTAMWMEDWGYSLSEPTRITETGCESFVNFPRKLFMKN